MPTPKAVPKLDSGRTGIDKKRAFKGALAFQKPRILIRGRATASPPPKPLYGPVGVWQPLLPKRPNPLVPKPARQHPLRR